MKALFGYVMLLLGAILAIGFIVKVYKGIRIMIDQWSVMNDKMVALPVFIFTSLLYGSIVLFLILMGLRLAKK